MPKPRMTVVVFRDGIPLIAGVVTSYIEHETKPFTDVQFDRLPPSVDITFDRMDQHAEVQHA